MASLEATSHSIFLEPELLADRQRLDITPAGEWSDGVQRPKEGGSFVDWVVGRRGSCSKDSPSKIIHQGTLEKIGAWHRNWKRRHFVLFQETMAWGAPASQSSGSAKAEDAVFAEAQQRSSRMRGATAGSSWPLKSITLPDFKALGAVRLCARGADGQMNVALVWEYSSAVKEGYRDALLSVLEMYAPTAGNARGQRTRSTTTTVAATAAAGAASLFSFFGSKSRPKRASLAAAREPELARCFGVRCADTGRDLFMRADSESEAKTWVSLVQHQTYRALRDEVATSGAQDHLAALGDDDELSYLVPNRRLFETSGTESAEAIKRASASILLSEQQPVMPNGAVNLVLGLGLSVSIPSGAGYSAEEGVMVSVFHGTFSSSSSSLNSAEHLLALLSSESLAFAASTESVSARDGANGAYEVPSDNSATNPTATLLLRQFTRLIPISFVWSTDEDKLVFLLHRKTSNSEEFSADIIIGFTFVRVVDVRKLDHKDGSRVLTLPVRLVSSSSSEAGSSGGGRAASEPVAKGDTCSKCSLALALVHSSEPESTRIAALRQCNGMSAEPYASVQYRFNALNGRKILSHSECHISGFGVSVPLALVSLLLRERSAAVVADQQRLEARKRILDKVIRRQREKMAMMQSSNVMPQETASNTAIIDCIQGIISILSAERDQTAEELSFLEDISMMMDSMSLCKNLYARLLCLGGQTSEQGDLLGVDNQRAALTVEAVKEIRAVEKYLLKRSTKKKSVELRFLPTNLNVQVLHAREMSNTMCQEELRSSPSEANQDIQGVATFVSITMGCPAAHSMGYKHGGLSRILNGGGDNEANDRISRNVLKKCLKLTNWSVPAFKLRALEVGAEKAAALEKELLYAALAKKKAELELGSLELKSPLESDAAAPPTENATLLQTGAVLSLLEAIEEHTASTQEDQKRKLMHVLKQKERSLICSHLQETLNIGTGEAGPREAIEATKRLDIVTSQILAAAVTQVMASLNCAAIGSENHRRIWPWILRAGFLFSLQSLVSTRGDERGMLEDLTVAVEWLSTCSIRFVRKAQQGGGRGGGAAVDLSGVETHSPSRPCVWARRLSVSGLIVVDLEVDDAVGDVLKWAMATSGSGAFAKDSQDVGASDGNWVVLAQVSLIGVVFQQGINEQQAVSNAIGNAAHLLQASINEANFGRLGAYYKAYKIAALQINATSIDLGVEMAKWEEAFEALRASVYSPLKTNVHLIIHASCLCRQLSSVHGMCCKSGKDRTSMLVTLEEARLLGDHLRVIGGRKVCNTMRKFGVRRTNVQLNTGQTKYAFNNVQRVFLPPCFQPPTGTYSGSATT